jgi:hypothetical protein
LRDSGEVLKTHPLGLISGLTLKVFHRFFHRLVENIRKLKVML